VQLTGLLPHVLGLALVGALASPVQANESPVPASEPPVPLPLEPRPLGSPGPSAVDVATAGAGGRRPDIVVFYLDDFAPRPRSLWDDPRRTPNLARFVNRGTRFANAIVSTPLCGPSRAGLLTGRYGHNNGVIANDVAPYRADNDVAEKLSKAGYHTVYVGKHINRLKEERPLRSQIDRIATWWDEFDVMWEDQGKFYDWTQYRKGEDSVYYGSDPGDHSSRVAADRAIEHIAATPPDEPLFLFISLADGHIPMTPMQRFVDDPACADIEPWQGPAFNEADVSDKPSHIQATPLLPRDSYSLVARCEQSLTADWVVGKVTRALRKAGRLEDTLQILTADNGWLMGDHRIVGKTYPYATPVPLYMRWPAVLGGERRVVEDPVSNLDLLPTFCDLAGCGVPNADGASLLPLILGETDRLDRKFIFVELLYDNARYPDDPKARPAYTGLETTLGYSDTLWAFTRYRNGEAELYDLTDDPYRLENLYGRKGYGKVTRDLKRFHKKLKQADAVQWQETPSFE
jgi:N-acetylglucosamine-6-sulfatase